MSSHALRTFHIPLVMLDFIGFFFVHLQHLDSKPVHTERPGELIAYYKIASNDYLCNSFLLKDTNL